MSEFGTLLNHIEGVETRLAERLDSLVISLSGCQALCTDDRRRRGARMSWTVTVIASVGAAVISALVSYTVGAK